MKLFVTDFDGVICDSALESLLTAFNSQQRIDDPDHPRMLSLDQIPLEIQIKFRRLRAFLHGAEDFLPIIRAVFSDRQVDTEDEFRLFREIPPRVLEESKKLFYEERDFLRQNEKELWLNLNPLFPGIGDGFRRLQPYQNVYILTTKRKEDVEDILRYYDIDFPTEHINAVGTEQKFQRLIELSEYTGCSLNDTIYLEDQINFLPPAQSAGCTVYLAGWGYVSPQHRKTAAANSISVIDEKRFAELIEEVLMK